MRETKLLTVAFPWGFYDPFINAADDENKYLVLTVVTTNSSGSRTSVSTYDADSGAQDTVVTDDPGFDAGIAFGTLTSHTTSELVDTYTYQYTTVTYTISSAITLATQTAKCAAKLDSIVAVEDCKGPLGIQVWDDLGSGLTEYTLGWIFPSQSADIATLLPDADWWQPTPWLYPNPVYPWDGKYLVINAYSTEDGWYFSHYGWAGSGNGTATVSGFNSLSATGTSPYTTAADWSLSWGYAIASRSCHALPDGIGCGTTDVDDAMLCVVDSATEGITGSTCAGLELSPGWYCFDWTGVYSPGNGTPVTGSWSEITTPGWMAASALYNGALGTVGFANANGPIAWEFDCCP